MDQDSPTIDPQESGMSDASPPETGAKLSEEPGAEAPPQDEPGSDIPAPAGAVPAEPPPDKTEAEDENTAAEPEPAQTPPATSPPPETPAPETPTLEAPVLETPAPETAIPETSTPETPAVETPAPEPPALETPVPATPAPATPAPATPAAVAPAAPAPAAEEPEKFDPAADLPTYREGMDWFVLRVASNKENYVRETLLRKVQIEGLNDRVGRIMVPTEKTKTLKGGKTKITETKLYPGYIFVEMKLETDGRIPQDVFFLIKETTGVGDFVGTAGRPTPMAVHEAEKMLFDSRRPEETPSVKMEFAPGDYVTITEGPFESYEGTVDEVLPDKGLVRVLVTIFGRQAPVELEYWQIQKAE
jgi:transcriptional antiterminator NusG